MRNVVYIDMDNTILELSKPWIEKLNKKYKRNINPDTISAYKISDLYPDIPESDLYKPLITAAFWKQVEPEQILYNIFSEILVKGVHLWNR